MKHQLFNFTIPKNSTLIINKKTKVRFANDDTDYDYQPPLIDCNLFHLESINSQKGDTFLSKYICWNEGYSIS